MNAIEAALQAAGFKVFERALQASSYGEVLQGGGPFTVFAPTDAAFAKLPRTWLDDLISGDGEALRTVIGYHFAPGKVLSQRFAGKRIRAVTFGGEALIIDGKTGLRVNDANLVKPDMIYGDCVIHGIDAVLQPRASAAAAL